MLFGLYGVIVFLVGLYHLVLVHVVSPFCGRSDVIPLVIGCSVKFFPCRIACILRPCAIDTARLEVALHCRSAIMLLFFSAKSK